MESEKTYSLTQAHQHFAVTCFNQCWQLLEKNERTTEENELLTHLGHASLYHWLQIGKPINKQRGEWMLARIHTVLENKELALLHAKNCLNLTQEYHFIDFDLAYAHESMARAYALNGNTTTSKHHYEAALNAAKQIAKDEDRNLFFEDLKGGNWYNISNA